VVARAAGRACLVEDADDDDINLADIVDVIDALVQAADHVHAGLHLHKQRLVMYHR
jgi:hypothetical protein